MMKSYTIGNNNYPTWLPIFVLGLVLIFTACPEKHNPPPVADCDPGYHPCGADSTECCLDTTSHNFVWEIDTLGDYGSYLNDVAIVDENNIWVVGYIKDGDSTYNAARWDGDEWEPITIKVAPYFAIVQITSIRAFAENDMWVGTNIPYHWNGTIWRGYYPEDGWENGWNFDGYIQGIWGTSSSDIYFVGGKGSIVHYDGSGFEKMESGTGIRLRSVTGSVDPETGQVRVWAGGWEDTKRGEVLYYDGMEWINIWDERNPFYPDPNYLDPGSIWASDDEYLVLYVGGRYDGIVVQHSQRNFNDYEILHHENQGAIHDISGNGINDYFLVGDFNNVLHYNGASFQRYPELTGGIKYSAVAQWGDYVFICQAYAAVVVRGIRVP